MPSLQRRATAVAMLLAASGALAQPVSMPTQVADVLSVEVNGGIEHHSNIFRTPTASSDTVLRGLVGVRFERDVSLQRFAAFANLQPVKYLSNSSFDNIGFALGGNWDWEIGRPVFGRFLAAYDRGQTPFEAIGGAINNTQEILFMRGLAGFRLTQAWSLIGAVDYRDFSNSLDVQRPADSQRTGVEFGTRYATGSAIELDFVYRREDGRLPNRQVFDSVGNLLPGAVDNAFSQDGVLSRITYRPSEATRIAGNLGYTRRSYENLSQRDFGGVTAGLDFEWPLSGAILMRAGVFRTIDSADLLTASYADTLGFVLRPTWTLSSRMTIDGLFVWRDSTYEGDPGFVLTGEAVREDRTLDYGVRINYEFARRVFLYGDLRRSERTSNYTGFNFTDNWFGVGLRSAF